MIIKMSEVKSDEFTLNAWFDEYDEKRKKYKEVNICFWREGHHLIILNNSISKQLHFRQGDVHFSDRKLKLRDKLRKIIKTKKPRKAHVVIIDLKETYD